jgi:hypothetical protein
MTVLGKQGRDSSRHESDPMCNRGQENRSKTGSECLVIHDQKYSEEYFQSISHVAI